MTTTSVAAYCRVSTDKQREEATIAVQVDAIKQWSARNPEYRITDWFLDEGYSGDTPIETRPRGGDLFRLLSKGNSGIEAIVVWKADRLFRDNQKFMLFAWAMKEQGVKIISITEPFDMSTMEGELVGFVYALLGKKERLAIIERTVGGRVETAKEGKWAQGRPPFGYKIDDRGYLAIDEPHATWVRTIYGWYVEGKSRYWIIDQLKANNVQPPHIQRGYKGAERVADEWGVSTITRLIKRPVYKGEFVYHVRNHRPIAIPVPPLVSVETWERAQIRLEDNRNAGRRSPENILRGKIVCAHCGKGFYGVSVTGKHKYRYYKCSGASIRWIRCKTPSVRADKLEAQIWAVVFHYLNNPGEAINQFLASQGEAKEQLAQVDRDLAGVDRNLTHLENRRKKAISLAMDDIITRVDLQLQLGDIETERGRLEKQKAELREKQQTLMQGEAEADLAKKTLEEIREGLTEEITLEEKAHLIDLLVKQIRISRGNDGQPEIEVTLKFEVTERSSC